MGKQMNGGYFKIAISTIIIIFLASLGYVVHANDKDHELYDECINDVVSLKTDITTIKDDVREIKTDIKKFLRGYP